MRILFLDIDGVLNSQAWDKERRQMNNGMIRPPENFYPDHSSHFRLKMWDLDPKAMKVLQEIVVDYQFKIVISSGDRAGESPQHFERLFSYRGCKLLAGTIVGMTPLMASDHRGDEIEAWLQSAEPCQYLIIDDRSDFHQYQKPHWIKTDPRTGLQPWHHEIIELHLERDGGS